MKNHWLKQYEKKKKSFWTAEFSKNSVFVLRPRKVGIATANIHSGRVEITFKNESDKEFVNFLMESRKGMLGWLSRLRFYANIFKEIEYYELVDLDYVSVGIGNTIENIAFEFD